MLSTDTFSSNKAILSSNNMFAFCNICFSMMLTTEDVLHFNGDGWSDLLGWMGSFGNVWFLLKQEVFPFVNLFSILFFWLETIIYSLFFPQLHRNCLTFYVNISLRRLSQGVFCLSVLYWWHSVLNYLIIHLQFLVHSFPCLCNLRFASDVTSKLQ